MNIRTLAKQILIRGFLPVWYRIAARRPVRQKAVFLEVRYPKITDNLRILRHAYCGRKDWLTEDAFLGAGEEGPFYLLRCLRVIWQIADAKLIFVDESSNVLAALPVRKESRIIQTWHACGAFKRWGCALPGGEEAAEYYRRYDLVTVSAPEVVPKYQESMNQPDGVVVPLGVSRTDRFFSPMYRRRATERVRLKYPQTAGRKIVLYAPTFRGNVARAQNPSLPDLARMAEVLQGDCVILYQSHPAVRQPSEVPAGAENFFLPVSGLTTEDLLCAADLVVTDYSSLIFEYSLLNRPMAFYAYDLEEYASGRGFYYPYESFVPGPVCRNTEELTAAVRTGLSGCWDRDRLASFRETFMSACDGHSTRRIMKYIEENL